MTQLLARRPFLVLTAALLFGTYVAGSASHVEAQSLPQGSAASPGGGTTGTDPCPKNYICTTSGPGSTTKIVTQPGGASSTAGSVAEALLLLLGAG